MCSGQTIPYIQKIGTHVLEITVQRHLDLGQPIQSGGPKGEKQSQIHECAVYFGMRSDLPEHNLKKKESNDARQARSATQPDGGVGHPV